MTRRSSGVALSVPEILAQILDHTIYRPNVTEDIAEDEDEHFFMTTAEPPWPFLLVSKFWHDLTLSTPKLWSTFVAVRLRCSHADIDSLVPLLETHLQRSKDAPLTVQIFLYDNSDQNRFGLSDSSSALKQRIFGVQHRWRDVSFYLSGRSIFPNGPAPAILDRTSTIFLGESNILENLCLDSSGEIRIVLSPCSHLETIDLRIVDDDDVIPSLGPGEGQTADYFPNLRLLRVCSHQSFRGKSIALLLRCAFHVQVLELNIEGSDLPIPSIDLPNLKSLSLVVQSLTTSPRILSNLKMPSLITLELDQVVLEDWFLSRFTPVLKNLTLEKLTMCCVGESAKLNTESLQDFLRSLGGLRAISFQRICGDGEFQTGLMTALNDAFIALEQEEEPFLPHLYSLRMDLDPKELKMRSDISCVRNLISTCRRKYKKFDYVFSFDTNLMTRIEDALLEDHEIYSCTTSDFCVSINNVDVFTSNRLRLNPVNSVAATLASEGS